MEGNQLAYAASFCTANNIIPLVLLVTLAKLVSEKQQAIKIAYSSNFTGHQRGNGHLFHNWNEEQRHYLAASSFPVMTLMEASSLCCS